VGNKKLEDALKLEMFMEQYAELGTQRIMKQKIQFTNIYEQNQ
jgi:hypothetical protein